MSAQPYIVPISVKELSGSDLANLDKAVQKDYDGSTVDMILEKAIVGFCQLWRLGDSEGILVTEIIQRDWGLELWLPLIAGKNVFKNLAVLDESLARYGKSQGCSKIRFAGLEKSIQRVYARHWKEIARIYERDL